MNGTAVRERTTTDGAGRPRRLTVDDYYRMAEARILREDERLELIEGQVLEMVAIGGRHISSLARLNRLLRRQLPDEWLASVQGTVRLDEDTAPEPDLAIIRDRSYGRPPPGPEDILLVIEVAEASLAYDRFVKLCLYAVAGIREAWVVDVDGRSIERYDQSSGGRYGRLDTFRSGQVVRSEALPGLEVPVDAVFE